MPEMRETESILSRIASLQDRAAYKEQHWEGSFEDYLQLVRQNPRVTRTAFQRMYDMILSHGKTEYGDNKKKLIRYHFFHDEQFGGKDAIYGLDVPLMKLVNVFKSAAQQYGTEKRVILLHGPVGSSKSTIARLLKQGIEYYSRTPDGALYSFDWVNLAGTDLAGTSTDRFSSPMNDEPLRLIPQEWRTQAVKELGLSNDQYTVRVDGDLPRRGAESGEDHSSRDLRGGHRDRRVLHVRVLGAGHGLGARQVGEGRRE